MRQVHLTVCWNMGNWVTGGWVTGRYYLSLFQAMGYSRGRDNLRQQSSGWSFSKIMHLDLSLQGKNTKGLLELLARKDGMHMQDGAMFNIMQGNLLQAPANNRRALVHLTLSACLLELQLQASLGHCHTETSFSRCTPIWWPVCKGSL